VWRTCQDFMTRPSSDDNSAPHEPGRSTPDELPWWRRLSRSHLERFIKFGIVGALGVFVNWGFFEIGYALFHPLGDDPAIAAGYLVGLAVSIFTNFVFNDIWTWADRLKGTIGDWFVRLGRYYVSASAAGAVQFAVSWVTLHTVWRPVGWVIPAGEWALFVTTVDLPKLVLAPRLALLTGVACGMIINFLASHLWAFQDAEPSGRQT